MTIQSQFLLGLKAAAPFILVLTPFGLLFGVVATEAGLTLAQTMGFSILMVAGAAQFVALQLSAENAPTLIVLATALAVNLRLVMYSAALAPLVGKASLWQRLLIAYSLTDQSFALTVDAAERQPRPLPHLVAFYAGTSVPTVGLWYVFTLVGAVAGSSIPPAFALDFALPITFLAMLAPMLRTMAHVAACLTSVVGALALAFMPYGTGLLVAALLAMIVGARVEMWQAGRAA
ncbi:AzlC family ABC transporter permease [Falsirhodobacter deserti]|uniref:AzlC family ABC transporter permease n=1 Tax=Falsirhodobacter deserti TaxID=1365611 RepID=UPI000FE401CE|nr:AzlC family ABC transporter permease [Falsirhodobacter deserti]